MRKVQQTLLELTILRTVYFTSSIQFRNRATPHQLITLRPWVKFMVPFCVLPLTVVSVFYTERLAQTVEALQLRPDQRPDGSGQRVETTSFNGKDFGNESEVHDKRRNVGNEHILAEIDKPVWSEEAKLVARQYNHTKQGDLVFPLAPSGLPST